LLPVLPLVVLPLVLLVVLPVLFSLLSVLVAAKNAWCRRPRGAVARVVPSAG